MINIIKKYSKIASVAATVLVGFASCNKEFSDVAAVPTPAPFNVVNSIDSLIRVSPDLTVCKAAIARAGFSALLANPNAQFTVFAPTDAAFATIGITSPAMVAGLPVASVQGLLQYHIVPTARYMAANIPTTAPNIQLPTLIQLAPTVTPLIRMNVFPSKRGSNVWVNNVPVVAGDIMASNGVIHKISRVLTPTSTTIKSVYNADANLTMLKAAIARADSGFAATSPGRLDSIANTAFANLTLLAPSNTAFGNFFYPLLYPGIYAQTYAVILPLVVTGNPLFTAAQSADSAARRSAPIAAAQTTAASVNPLIFSNPALYGAFSATTVRGIVAYHIFTSRYYGVNTQGATSSLTAGGAALPPVGIDWNAGSPRFLGAGNGGNFSNVTIADNHQLNGVVHIIDRVLRPQ